MYIKERDNYVSMYIKPISLLLRLGVFSFPFNFILPLVYYALIDTVEFQSRISNIACGAYAYIVCSYTAARKQEIPVYCLVKATSEN